jgi:glycosyltransferase involved in cell wall biosynthesis
MTLPRPDLSLVLPAHNEAGIIRDTVLRTHSYLERASGVSFEIIVGDSGSSDGTGDLVRSMNVDRVRVVREDRPGKGRILTKALSAARGHIVGFLDADLEIPLETVGGLLEGVESGADVAIAVKSPSLDTRDWRRRWATRGLNGAIRFWFGSHLQDHQAGCKLFRSSVLRPHLDGLRTTGWLWDTELLVALLRSGASFAQCPFEPSPSRPSRMSPGASLRSVWELVLIAGRSAVPAPARTTVSPEHARVLSPYA